MNKKITVTLLCLLACLIARGQGQEVFLNYYDNSGNVVKDEADARIRRTVETGSGYYLVRDYNYQTGKIKMIARCREYTPTLQRFGRTIWYYESGTMKESRTYHADNESGVSLTFYENGKQKSVIQYAGTTAFYKHCLSSTGTELLTAGRCTFQTDSAAEHTNHVLIKDSILFAHFYIPTGTTDSIYTDAAIPASFVGGVEVMALYLGKSIQYKTPRTRKEGLVLISFLVGKDGQISDAKILKGFDPLADNDALRVVTAMPPWNAASLSDGTPVKTNFILPIRFKVAK